MSILLSVEFITTIHGLLYSLWPTVIFDKNVTEIYKDIIGKLFLCCQQWHNPQLQISFTYRVQRSLLSLFPVTNCGSLAHCWQCNSA